MNMRPMFVVEDSLLSVAGFREIAFDLHTASVKVKETQQGDTWLLDKKTEAGWTLYRIQR
jgi:hypothetical protein